MDQIPSLTNAQLQSILESSTSVFSATLLPGVCLVRPHRLDEEAERLFSDLINWPTRSNRNEKLGNVGLVTITHSVLEGVINSLVVIARQRPQFFDRVIQTVETVHGKVMFLVI